MVRSQRNHWFLVVYVCGFSNLEARRKVLGPKFHSLENKQNMNGLTFWGHVGRQPTERLSRCMLFSEVQ